jgi:hypothetical protein
MNIALLIASVLTGLAFIAHTFMGDKEIRILEPENNAANITKQEKWTMVRCGWHMISFDLLFATLGLVLINFTDYFNNERTLLQVMAVYFMGYSIAWVITLCISKTFEKNFLKLGQWILLIAISALIYSGIR